MNNPYFIGSNYKGCNYVRIFQPAWELGWGCDYTGISRGSHKPAKVISQELLDSDIITFHRPNTINAHKIAFELKKLGKKIVFDNDDTFQFDKSHPMYYLHKKGKVKKKSKETNNLLYNFIHNADLVTTTTKTLAEEYRKYNSNVVVLPNCVNPDDWAEIPQRNTGKKIRIGVIGSIVYAQEFEIIKEQLRELDADGRFTIVVLGLAKERTELMNKIFNKEFDFWYSLKNLERTGWVEMEDYFDTLDDMKIDIAIMPRSENYFNTCKSNIKFLEVSMLEIPTIAQSFKDSPYEELDGKIGIKITDNSKWLETIIDLANNKDKRLKMGKLAKQYVLDNYTIQKNAYKWADAYNLI